MPRIRTLLVAAGCALLIASRVAAQSDAATYNVLSSFETVPFNQRLVYVNPASDLVKGSDGNFYGMTSRGGANDTGTVYKITPEGARTVLHEFSALNNVSSFGQGTNEDGAYPEAPLILGLDGNFYGATNGGGNDNGTLFRITPTGTLTTLHKFESTDPAINVSRLIQVRDGTFYGVSDYFGAGGNVNGAVFKFTPGRAPTILHTFSPSDPSGDFGADGAGPKGLAQGNDGSVYGTTSDGGSHQSGTFYKITPDGTLTTVYNFGASAAEGYGPAGALALGSDGNFYGTTIRGGSADAGTIYRITPDGILTTLHDFTVPGGGTTNAEGRFPNSGLARGNDGNFYGATTRGGANNRGTLFRVSPSGAFTVLHTFSALNNVNQYSDGTNEDGADCSAVLAEGSNGVFYGVTLNGGANARGVIFQLRVNDSHPAFFNGEVALGSSVYYLAFPDNGNIFGYYQYLSDPKFVYHYDLGFEYVFDLGSNGGVVFYDFASNDYFYTSPSFGFPYLYDFGLQAFLYYYPDPTNPQRYNTNGVRYFYNFSTGKVISK